MNENDALIPSLSTNVWYLVIVFVALLLILYVVLVRWAKLGKVAWKRVDYIWLAFAALGLISTSSDARRLLATNQFENQERYTKASYEFFRRDVQFRTGPAICRQFVRTDASPANLDTIRNEYDSVCNYYRNLILALPLERKNNEKVGFPETVQRPTVTEAILDSDFKQLDLSFDSYQKEQSELERLAVAKSKSPAEMTATMLGPLLLTFALALRVAKVMGEVRLEQALRSLG